MPFVALSFTLCRKSMHSIATPSLLMECTSTSSPISGIFVLTPRGVHFGLRVMDEMFQFCDPELHAYVKSKTYEPELLTNRIDPDLTPAILSLSTGSPPLDQVLVLWDFYFAFGPFVNVICTVARLIIMRGKSVFNHR